MSLSKIPLFMLLFGSVVDCRTPAPDKVSSDSIPSHPLNDEKDLDALMEQIGDSRIVLLGEASHGTAEYYEWRTMITKRLIAEKGFTVIGVEGEWADSFKVNQFVKGPKKDSLQAIKVLRQYDRWPTWMWGNYEVASLVTWLNDYNQSQPDEKKAGFFGLDVYCLWESMDELMPFVQENESLLRMAKEVKKCFQPYTADPIEYTMAVARASQSCGASTRKLYQAVLSNTGGKTATNDVEFAMQQNALVAMNAENYYRVMASSNGESWNTRDRHMTQTISRLLERHGANSKIIVWEHNTHVGDARYTDMGPAGMVNVGQLVREQYGRENVYIVGFGSHKGTVIAANNWGGKVEKMRVPAAKRGSWEDLLHDAGAEDKILFSDELRKNPYYMKTFGHRAIGVQYDPGNEAGNYVPTVIPERYDAFIYIDQTTALHPIQVKVKNEPPDTYPSGY
ncbi:MAG TPA: erythromycin esterase family protein [Flavobacterium sp.]|nr:erythromycin esterase family protein [Flavobacterium sp.]